MVKKILFFTLVLIYQGATAQLNQASYNLVFEGAGLRGIAYCGALKEMEDRGMMSQVERVAGTSAGAIMALAISLGYTADELAEIIGSTNFKKFNEGKYLFVGGINRINHYFGWYRSRKFDTWLAKLIESKAGNPNITFADLERRQYKQLYITGTCLNKQKMVIFSHETYPLMRVRDAVRISMSIPLYFEAVFLTPDGKIVEHPKNTSNLDIMVDGGFTGNFPIRIFDSTRFQLLADTNVFHLNPATIAFRLDREQQVRNDSAGRELAEMPIGNIKQYMGAFYNIVIENLNRQTLIQEDWERTVSISDGGIRPRIRKLSKAEIQILLNNGRSAMKAYLE